jgi:hypothetical protein
MKIRSTFSFIKSVSLLFIFGASLIKADAQTVNLQLQSDYANEGMNYSPSLAVGDVNNDRLPDLVTTTRPASGGDFIAVYLNNGTGGFSAALRAGNDFSARVVALGDFNKDGNLDMAIGRDTLAIGLNVRLGNGTGNFPTGTDFGSTTTIESISDMVTADFNGDGNLDLAITKNIGYNTAPSNAVKILFGDGLGGFAGLTAFPVQFGGASDIEVSDFNVDGRPDIAATAPNSNVVQVLINNGAGGFNAPINTTSLFAQRLVSGDFNRDCIPDLAVSRSSSTNNVTIFLGDGTGGFFSAVPILVTNQADGLAVGDFNRDRKIDIAVRRITQTAGVPNFTILPGNGGGAFGTAFELTLPISNSAASSLAVMDTNTDGKADIVINRQGGFTLYHGNSTLFTRTENDFDGDLRTDLSVLRPSNVTWHINRSTQSFFAQQWGLASDKLAPADYDGDGKTDIAVWREAPATEAAFYIFNSSNSTVRIEQFGQTGDDPRVVADWDGDGKADPAVYRNAAFGSQSYFFYRGSLNNPNGNTTYLPWGTDNDRAVRGDFDGDGKADLAVFRPSNAIWYVLQSSNGQILYQSWGLATDKRVTGDYDGDGKTDFAVFRPTDNNWYILNSATGTTTIRQWGTNTDSLTPGDYNGDGKIEPAVYRASEQNWYVPQCADFKLLGDKFGGIGDTAVPSAFVP